MNRRALLQGMAGVAAGLILPPSLAENAEAAQERCARCYGPTCGATTWVNGLRERLCDACGERGVTPKTWALDQTMLPQEPGGMIWWAMQAKNPPQGTLSVYDLEHALREKWRNAHQYENVVLTCTRKNGVATLDMKYL